MFTAIKKAWIRHKVKKRNEWLAAKQEIVDYIKKPMTKDYIRNYNFNVMVNSSFWIGGDWSEKYIKVRYLRGKTEYFSDYEYSQLMKYIEENASDEVIPQ